MTNAKHREILSLIRENSGQGTSHTFLDSYLGTAHPRYEITAPVLRLIAREWAKENRSLSSEQIARILTSLIQAPSSTEKVMAGILMDYISADQRNFSPKFFDQWLEHVEGWAEVDAICTGKFTVKHVPEQWTIWKKLLIQFSRSKNIHKRRASLVLFCSPIRYTDDADIASVALENIDRLKAEKEILITKAISWLLRSMIKRHRKKVEDYLEMNRKSLPAIAVRETDKVLTTGRKTERRSG